MPRNSNGKSTRLIIRKLQVQVLSGQLKTLGSAGTHPSEVVPGIKGLLQPQ